MHSNFCPTEEPSRAKPLINRFVRVRFHRQILRFLSEIFKTTDQKMSASRMESLVGTLYSRITGMIRAGGLKWEDRPLWYDVYAAFPPKFEPNQDPKSLKEMPVRRLIYPEDEVRAQFYKTFNSPGLINMTDESTPSICETFISKYVELAKNDPDRDAEELFSNTIETLSNEGVQLRRRESPTNVKDFEKGTTVRSS